MKKNTLILLFILLTTLHGHCEEYEREIIESMIKESSRLSTVERIHLFSEYFLGRDYGFNGPLGEGRLGIYDKDPLYRFDLFDCTTYMETIIALSGAKNFFDFTDRMNRIRYKEGEISFVTRNHFTSADWIPNNSKAGFVRDITEKVAGTFPVHSATAVIDKKSWYEKMNDTTIRGSESDKENLLIALRKEGSEMKPERVSIPYIHLNTILNEKGVNLEIISNIPDGAVINIVRPNWDLVRYIGTHLNISHQGFAVKKRGKLFFRHPTSVGEKKVINVLMEDYLRKFLESPTIKGINVLEVNNNSINR